ncbi:MAG: hypothetical protein RBT68_05930 [Spirochaetia bacterium]|jgi:hypothetical protein|nr:hypothetical protein [Spirochaetia bacterium]
MKAKKAIPEFATETEEALFWQDHDSICGPWPTSGMYRINH